MEYELRRYLNKLAATSKGLPPDLLSLSQAQISQRSRMEREAYALLSIQEARHLCRYVDVPFHEIERCINAPRYNEIRLKKANGKGKRLLQEPSMSLKKIQRKLSVGLGAVYALIRPEQVHGFVRSSKDERIGIVSNARAHIEGKFVLNMDLKDFFHGVSAKKVKEVLRSELFLFDDHLSAVIALLLTYQGRLPQGASSSPVLSNLVCIPLDEQLRILSIERGWTYTRYADDLTFSGTLPFSDEDLIVLRKVVEEQGFQVNHRKTRRKGIGRKQKVTGLVVNTKINVDRKLIRQVRAMLHDARMNGLNAAAFRHFKNAVSDPESKYLNRLQGYISFIGMVRGKEDFLFVRQKAELKDIINNTSSSK
jgi:RNA-directed DNA polymerase